MGAVEVEKRDIRKSGEQKGRRKRGSDGTEEESGGGGAGLTFCRRVEEGRVGTVLSAIRRRCQVGYDGSGRVRDAIL